MTALYIPDVSYCSIWTLEYRFLYLLYARIQGIAGTVRCFLYVQAQFSISEVTHFVISSVCLGY
jgi:hypothetical protein